MEIHSQAKSSKYPCPFEGCSQAASKPDLATHIRAKHTKELLFSGEACDKEFHSLPAKKDHDNVLQHGRWLNTVKSVSDR